MSRSRTVSLRRRALPASETSTAAGMRAQRLDDRVHRRQAAPEQRAGRRSGAARLRRPERLEDALLDLRAEPGQRRAAAAASAAALSSARVVTPSSCQILRAVFGPSPGSRVNATTSGRHERLVLRQRVDLAVLDDLDDLVLDRLADPRELLRVAVERELRRPVPASRGRAPPRAGRRGRGRTPRPRARGCRRAARTGRRRRRSAAEAGHDRDDTALHARDDLPAHLQRAREPRADAARARAPHGVRVLVIDDSSPDGTGELADRLAAELAYVRRPAPRAQGRARAGLPRRLPPRARRRRRAGPRDGLRLLPRPGRRAAADRGLRRGRRPRARLALRRGRRDPRTGASSAARSRPAARSTRASCSRAPVRDLTGGFKCYRRAVLEAIDLDAVDSKGYAFQIETTYRAAARRLPRRRGADHVRRPRARRLEDEPGDRARGGLEGARAAARGARGRL